MQLMPEQAPTTFFRVIEHRCLERDASGCSRHHLSVEPARLTEVFEDLDVDFHWMPPQGLERPMGRRLKEEDLVLDRSKSLSVSWGANFNSSRTPPALNSSVRIGPITCVDCYAGMRLVDIRVKIRLRKMTLRELVVNVTVPVEFNVRFRLDVGNQLQGQTEQQVTTLAEKDFPKITLADTLDLTPTVSLDVANALLRDLGEETFKSVTLPDMYVRLKEPAPVGFGVSYRHGSTHPVRTRLAMPETHLEHNLDKFTWRSFKKVGRDIAANISLSDVVFAMEWMLEPMVVIGLDVAGLTDVGTALQVPLPLGANSTMHFGEPLRRRLAAVPIPPPDAGDRHTIALSGWYPGGGARRLKPRRLAQRPGVLNYFTEGNSLVAHAGKDCWEPCGNKAGFCLWCGWAGVCCKKGEASAPRECKHALGFATNWNPFHKHHQCVQASSLTSDLRNDLFHRSNQQLRALERPQESTFWRVCFKFATVPGTHAFPGKSIQLIAGHPPVDVWTSETRPASRSKAGVELCACTPRLALDRLLSTGPFRFRVMEDNLADKLHSKNDGNSFSDGLEHLEKCRGQGGEMADTAGEAEDLMSQLTDALQPVLQEFSVDFRPGLLQSLVAYGEPKEQEIKRQEGQVKVILRVQPSGSGDEAEAEDPLNDDGFVGMRSQAAATLKVLQHAARAALGLAERDAACPGAFAGAGAGSGTQAVAERRLGGAPPDFGTYAAYSLDMALVWRGIHIGRQWVNDAVDLAGRLVLKLGTGAPGPVMKVLNRFWDVSVNWFTGKIGLGGDWSHEVVPRMEYDAAVTTPEVWSAPVDPNHPSGSSSSSLLMIAAAVAVGGVCGVGVLAACCCCGAPAAMGYAAVAKIAGPG